MQPITKELSAWACRPGFNLSGTLQGLKAYVGTWEKEW